MKSKIPTFKEVNKLLKVLHEIKHDGLEFPEFSSTHVYRDFNAVNDLAYARLSKRTYSADEITIKKGLNLIWAKVIGGRK